MTRVAAVTTPLRRSLALEQVIRYDYDFPVTDLHQRLVTVPPAVHGGQVRRSWSIDLAADDLFDVGRRGPRHQRRTHRDPFGNHVVELDLPRVDRWATFTCRAVVDLPARPTIHRVPSNPLYLAPSPLTHPGDEIRDLAVAGGSAAGIAARTHRAFTYEWGSTGVRTTATDALRGGRGVCQDYAHVMIAACRAAGIAARYVSGHLVGEGGSHAWVEVLHPDPADPRRCVVEAWDPTNDRRADEGYLTVAVGRDYADVAPLSGAYAAARPAGHLTVTKQLTSDGQPPA